MVRQLISILAALVLSIGPQGIGGKAGVGGKAGFGGGPSLWLIISDTFTENPTSGCTIPASSCQITIPSTTVGDVLAVDLLTLSNRTISSITGETFTHCSNCAIHDATSGIASDASYLVSAAGGTTSLTVNLSGSETVGMIVEVTELRKTVGAAAFDVSGNVDDTSTCTACNGVTLSLTGSRDAIVQFIAVQNNLLTVNYPYTIGSSGALFGSYLLNATTGTVPVYNQNSLGTAVGSAIAFK